VKAKFDFSCEVTDKNCIMESTPLLDDQTPVLSRHRTVTIEPLQFLFSLYASGSIPLFSQFVRSQLGKQYNVSASTVECGVTFNDSTTGQIEAEASTWLIYMNVAAMVYIFVFFVKL